MCKCHGVSFCPAIVGLNNGILYQPWQPHKWQSEEITANMEGVLCNRPGGESITVDDDPDTQGHTYPLLCGQPFRSLTHVKAQHRVSNRGMIFYKTLEAAASALPVGRMQGVLLCEG